MECICCLSIAAVPLFLFSHRTSSLFSPSVCSSLPLSASSISCFQGPGLKNLYRVKLRLRQRLFVPPVPLQRNAPVLLHISSFLLTVPGLLPIAACAIALHWGKAPFGEASLPLNSIRYFLPFLFASKCPPAAPEGQGVAAQKSQLE